MGKRYGRNQKRRHRELVEQLEQENEVATYRYDIAHQDYHDLEDQIRRWDHKIANTLGQMSIFRKDIETIESDYPIHQRRVPSSSQYALNPMRAVTATERISESVERICHYAVVSEKHHQELARHMVFFEVNTKSRVRTVAVSESTIRDIRYNDVLIEALIDMVRDQLHHTDFNVA